MFQDNAIYFPYIVVPKSGWFINVLFYWDDVFSIVPSDFLPEPEELGPFMQNLAREELVKFIQPNKYIRKIDDFVAGYDNLLKNNRIKKANNLNKVETKLIHIEKMGEVRSLLEDKGLCRLSRKKGGYPWFDVEIKSASLFMGYIAMKLGQMRDIQAIPLTDEDEHFKYFLSMDVTTPRKKRTPSIREQILDEILPAPEDIDLNDNYSRERFVGELRIFKEENKEYLIKFRKKVEDDTFRVASIDNPVDREELLIKIVKDLKEDRDYIADKMRSNGWKVTMGKFIALIEFIDPTGKFSKVKSALELGGLSEKDLTGSEAYAIYTAKYKIKFLKKKRK